MISENELLEPTPAIHHKVAYDEKFENEEQHQKIIVYLLHHFLLL